MLLRTLEPTDLDTEREYERVLRAAQLDYERLRRTGPECPQRRTWRRCVLTGQGHPSLPAVPPSQQPMTRPSEGRKKFRHRLRSPCG